MNPVCLWLKGISVKPDLPVFYAGRTLRRVSRKLQKTVPANKDQQETGIRCFTVDMIDITHYSMVNGFLKDRARPYSKFQDSLPGLPSVPSSVMGA